MSGVHFHLVFTHFVVATTVIGVLVLIWSLIRKNHDIRTTGLMIVLGAALLAIPVYLTGESAEHVVEEYGVSHDVIHEHEESAELTFIIMEVLGAAALAALLLGARKEQTGRMASIGVVLVGLVAGGMIVRTANLGGEIRHEEIRDGATASGEHHDDDDDDDDDHDHEEEEH